VNRIKGCTFLFIPKENVNNIENGMFTKDLFRKLLVFESRNANLSGIRKQLKLDLVVKNEEIDE
jgi:hypothetical protein